METIVSVTGRLGTHVDCGQTNAGHDYASFRLATSRRILRDGQWEEGPTSWLTVKCFREFATNVSLSLRKGNAVLVVGRLEIEEWTSPEGHRRQRPVIYAHAIGHDLNFGVSQHRRLERPAAASASNSGNGDNPDGSGTTTNGGAAAADRVAPWDRPAEPFDHDAPPGDDEAAAFDEGSLTTVMEGAGAC